MISGKGKKKFDPARAAVIEILMLLENNRLTAEEAIHQIIESYQFSDLDKRFIRQLANGIIKMKRRLDHDYKFYLSKPSEKLSIRLINILRLGFFQLFFTDRIPDAAAVSESVNLAHVFCDASRARMVNAVLRTALRNPDRIVFVNKEEDPIRYLADYYSYPDWFVTYCLNEFKFEKTRAYLENMNLPPRISFRVNSLKAKPEEVAAELDKMDVKYSNGKYLPEFFHLEEGGFPIDSSLISEGKIYIQDESAGMAIKLLNPKPGFNVLDFAAAPGGKATFAAALMRNKGMVTAVDKSRPRLEMMIANSKRLGVKIINPVLSDNKEFKAEPFERVILDVPCTGWGNARKHSDLRWTKQPEDIDKLARLQANMIDKASRMVMPGGIMVYSTCTIIRKENDDVVEEFLLRNPDFMLESGRTCFPDEVVSERGFVKTYPNKTHLSGAFSARMKKKPIPKKTKKS